MATRRTTLFTAAVAAASLLVGCAGPATGVKDTAGPAAGVRAAEGPTLELEYRMSPEQPLRYRMSSEMVQNTDAAGKAVEVVTTHTSVVTVRPTAADESASRLTVTIDSMQVHITGPGLDLTPDVSGVIGRSFEMSLSAIGEEGGFSSADVIEIGLVPRGKRSAITMFQAMFPNLAGSPVPVGGTWTSRDSMTEGAEGQELKVAMESRHVLQGFEVLDGRECARVRSALTGTIRGGGSEGPATWKSDGTLEGASTWYFAHEDGVFVRETSEIQGESTVTLERPGAETIVVPVTTMTVIETTLLP